MELNNSYMRKEVEEWVNKFVSPHCSSCKDVCCDATRIIINIGKKEPAVELFKNLGVKVYRASELDTPSVRRWHKSRLTEKVLTKDKTEVPQPSLIESPIPEIRGKKFKLSRETDFALYAEKYCPFYMQDKGCLIYGDPRRPQSCRNYPLSFETDGKIQIITISDSCPVMENPKMKKQLKLYFQDIPVFSISEFLSDQILRSARKKFKIKRRRR